MYIYSVFGLYIDKKEIYIYSFFSLYMNIAYIYIYLLQLIRYIHIFLLQFIHKLYIFLLGVPLYPSTMAISESVFRILYINSNLTNIIQQTHLTLSQ